LYLTEIESYANQTFQSLDLVVQENAILSQARDTPSESAPTQRDSGITDRNGPDGYSERLDDPLPQGRRGGPLLSTSGKPLQPFTLTDKRNQLRDGVFRPGHNLPTMSIDEYLEEERRRGGIIDGGGGNVPAPEIDEDNMALADAETMKAREWDEFKEANPKGSGNTLNRG
jgi:immunoglobulin-binding protein 1